MPSYPQSIRSHKHDRLVYQLVEALTGCRPTPTLEELQRAARIALDLHRMEAAEVALDQARCAYLETVKREQEAASGG